MCRVGVPGRRGYTPLDGRRGASDEGDAGGEQRVEGAPHNCGGCSGTLGCVSVASAATGTEGL